MVSLTSFEEARRLVEENPPDAAVVSIPPARLAWRDFQRICATRRPPVPVLYESCVFASAVEAGLEQVEGPAMFLRKPIPRSEFASALEALLARAREGRELRAG